MPRPRRMNADSHAFDLSPHGDGVARLQLAAVRLKHLIDIAGHVAKIAALDVGEDIVDRLNVVVVHDFGRDAALDPGDVLQKLGFLRGGILERHCIDGIDAIDPMLWSASFHEVGDAIRRARPSSWAAPARSRTTTPARSRPRFAASGRIARRGPCPPRCAASAR